MQYGPSCAEINLANLQSSFSLLKESHLLARPLMLYIRKLHSGKAQVQYTTMLVLCYKENIVFKYELCSDSILEYVGIVQ